MERTRILTDSSLSGDERAARLDELDAQLPAEVRERRSQSLSAMHAYQEVERLKRQGAPESELDAARTRYLGSEGAARAAQVARDEAAFSEALDALRTFSASLGSRSAAERDQAIDRFIEQRFAEVQRVRARALLAAAPPARFVSDTK